MTLRRLRLGPIALFCVVLLYTSFAVAADASTAPQASQTRSMHEMLVGSMERSWLEIAPTNSVADSVPIVVVLAGHSATVAQERARDGFLPLVTTGRAELIYPVGVGESWNAGGCCDPASSENIDDVAFLSSLVAHVDPHKVRPIYLVGYSDGGRLAYRIACTVPTLFDALAIMKAMPEPGCVVTHPQRLLQVDSTDDTYVPYLPGEPGTEQPAATTEVALLRKAFSCSSQNVKATYVSLTVQSWSRCAGRAIVEFATYTGGVHVWPEGGARTPSGASVIWSFLAQSALVRPYFPPTPPCSESCVEGI